MAQNSESPDMKATDIRQGKGWGASIREVGKALESSVSPVANRLGHAIEKGASGVGHALEDPGEQQASEALRQADLPELEVSSPLASLGLRLDREADLFRSVAMRQLARAAWVDRMAVSSMVIMLFGCVVLVAIAAFRALFAHGSSGDTSVLLAVGAGILVSGVLVATFASGRIRSAQLEVAREALTRADLSELRIHRLAVLLDLRVTDPSSYREALQMLERDIRSGK